MNAIVSLTDDTDGNDPAGELTGLELCLIHASELLDSPISVSEMRRQSPGASRAEAAKRVLATARRAGLQASFGAFKLVSLTNLLCPAILVMEDDHALVVEKIGKKGKVVVYDPRLQDGVHETTLRALQETYSGYLFVLHRGFVDKDSDTDGAAQGHWFWSAFGQNKWLYTQVMIAAVVANFLGLATSIFTMVVYDRILPNDAVESLFALTLGVALALVFDFIIKSLRSGFVDAGGRRVDKVVAGRLFEHLLDIRLSQKRQSTGYTANTLREFETVRDFFTSSTLIVIVDLPFIALFIWVIFILGGPLAIVPALAVPIVFFVVLSVQPLLSRYSRMNLAHGQTKQSVLVESLSGIETIKALGIERKMRDRWENAVDEQADIGLRTRGATQFAINATAFTQQLAQIMLIFYGVFLIKEGALSMGALIASVILTGRALAPLGQLAQTLTRISQTRASFRSLDALMKTERERPAGKRWLARRAFEGEIVLDDVSFSYPDAMVATLSNIDLTIRPGERVAILGRFGCGKSTLARLILGLHQPSSGSVLIDGIDIRQIDPADLRNNVGSVLQDVWLFSGTVRDNIAGGRARIRDEEIVRAAQIAGADGFISRHPAGYDLELAERGEGLSGGQKQSITLARALVGKPSMLLLDEPSSAMDVETEAAVVQRLKAEIGNRTVVVVTHRPSLLELVDRVIILDEGRVVADGPKSLLKTGFPKAVNRA